MENFGFPMRINKYLAAKRLCSRREADALIEQGKVFVNERVAVLGDKVLESDRVTVDRKIKDKIDSGRIYLAYNKPKNIVTHSPEDGQESIRDILGFKGRLFPLGRLDMDSRGLIILTNDGRITDRILNPKYAHEKEYEVEVERDIDEKFLRRMAEGVRIGEGYVTKKAKSAAISKRKFRIILTEGKKRQIRKMCEALGYGVTDLKRVRVMNINLGDLRTGRYRRIEGEELRRFLMKLGIVK